MNELGVITEIIKETDKNWRFIIENPLYDKINYIPGQLIQLAIKDPNDPNEVIARNYSLSSWPDGTNKLEIIVTFLAILDLMSLFEIIIYQNNLFDDMEIHRLDKN